MPIVAIVVAGVVSLLIATYIPWYFGVAALLLGAWLMNGDSYRAHEQIIRMGKWVRGAGFGLALVGGMILAGHGMAILMNTGGGRDCDAVITRAGPTYPC